MATIYCDHVHLKAEDVEVAAAWYRDKLGGKITYRGEFRGSPVAYVSFGDFNLVVYGQLQTDTSVQPAFPGPRFSIDHFGFRVDNLAATIAELRRAGVTVLEAPVTVRPGVHMAYIEGPERVRIEVVHRD